jgi:hypothetical protein
MRLQKPKELSTTHPCAGNCGKRVSGNKERCGDCIIEAAQAVVNVRNEELADGATHLLMITASQDREDLYRADGMLLASRQGDLVRFGNEPKEAGNRLFLNSDFAKKWIRKIPGMDLATRKDGRLNVTDAIERDSGMIGVVIEERDAEKLILLPQGNERSVLKM